MHPTHRIFRDAAFHPRLLQLTTRRVDAQSGSKVVNATEDKVNPRHAVLAAMQYPMKQKPRYERMHI